jgi:hypothetical protein
VEFSVFRLLVIGSAILTVAVFGFSVWREIVGSTLGSGPRKGKTLLASRVSLGVALLLLASIPLLGRWVFPVSDAEGHIVSAQEHSHSRSHPTDLQIQTNSGEYLYLHASDRSDYFRPGQRLKVRYQGWDLAMVEAQFFTVDGKQEGVFRDLRSFYSYLLIVLGLYLIYDAYRKYRCDPEGKEKPAGRLADTNEPTTLGLSTDDSRPLR